MTRRLMGGRNQRYSIFAFARDVLTFSSLKLAVSMHKDEGSSKERGRKTLDCSDLHLNTLKGAPREINKLREIKLTSTGYAWFGQPITSR